MNQDEAIRKMLKYGIVEPDAQFTDRLFQSLQEKEMAKSRLKRKIRISIYTVSSLLILIFCIGILGQHVLENTLKFSIRIFQILTVFFILWNFRNLLSLYSLKKLLH